MRFGARRCEEHIVSSKIDHGPPWWQYFCGQTIAINQKTKGHAGIAPHGLCETVPWALQRFRPGAHGVRVEVPVQGAMELPAVQANEHAPTDPPGSNSVFSNLQG
jgi:hypothetical protein